MLFEMPFRARLTIPTDLKIIQIMTLLAWGLVWAQIAACVAL